MLGRFIDSWSAVVRTGLWKIYSINHDPAIDRHLDRLSFAHVEGIASVLTVVNAPLRIQTSAHIRRDVP